MRVGVVGCGYWGAKHVRVLSSMPEVEQVVAVDSRPEVLAGLQASSPGLRVVDSVQEALPIIDAAVVATPPRLHGPVALELLRAGKHVLVEKPMATSVSEAEMMIEAAEDNRLTLMAGHTFEYNPAVHALKDTMTSGDLGQIHYIDTARLNLGLYQRDVNVVWDLAPHDVSIINFILDSEPTQVHAWGSAHAHATLEDVAYLNLSFADIGVVAHIHVSWLDPCKVRRVTLVGSQRMAVYNDLFDEGRVKVYDKGVAQPEPTAPGGVPMSYRYGGIYSPYIDNREPLRIEDEHFVSCATTGEKPCTDGQNGLRVVRVLQAAEMSLRTGRTVDLTTASPLTIDLTERHLTSR